MLETYQSPATNELEIIQVIDPSFGSEIQSKIDAENSRFFFRILDLASINDKKNLLQYVARKLNFPEYFGENWDAVDECLIDMPSYSPMVKSFLILVRNVEHLFLHGKRELLTFLAALQFAGNNINFQDKKPFYVFLECLAGLSKQYLTEFCQKNLNEKNSFLDGK
ncbi:MAG TPA: barstar family protein [Turneriella sp.]|nr:barstar family protein [Turneriella sp.]